MSLESDTRCLSCGYPNPVSRRFCGGCGGHLRTTCRACSAENKSTARFCVACGASLAEPLIAGAVDPAESAERRQLTVVFCDIVDSTALSQRLDAEDLRDLLSRYHATCSEIVRRWEGFTAQLLGDGLLAYFGFPRAHEDDPERAVRAGLELLQAVEAMPPTADGHHIAARIGVHTGPVVVSQAGDGERLAFGETVHMAARLQSLAPPRGLVISEATRRLVHGIFRLEDLGRQHAKGFSAPVAVHRVLQPTGVRSRLDLAASRLGSFVGRHAELGLLRECWERCEEGSGQVVSITGEAGVGKSRLVVELRERLADRPHGWLEWRSSPYTAQTALHPVITSIERRLAFAPHHTAAEKRARIAEALADDGLGAAHLARLVADLLSVPRAPGDTSRLSPEAQRRETLDVLVRWVLAAAERQPTVLLVEDLHWADPSTLQLLQRLMIESATSPLLFLLTARPDFTAPWPARSNLAPITLSRLTRRQARELVTARSGERPLQASVVEQVVERADGIPLYVEELVKGVQEGGDGAVPATLQDSLMARLDRLGTAREVAQRAAVLGREFAYDLLAAAAGLGEASLQSGLARLEAAELVYARGTPPDATYVFKHALIQEVAYESLLRRTRRALHAAVARALVREFPERCAAAPEMVARHFEAAGQRDDAIEHYRRASQRANDRGAYVEATGHVERAIGLLSTSAEPDAREIALQLLLATSLGARDVMDPRIEGVYERARELSEATGDDGQLPHVWIGLAARALGRGDFARGRSLATRVLETAGDRDEKHWALQAHAHLALFDHIGGRFASSMQHCTDALALLEQTGTPFDELARATVPIHVAVMARTWRAWNLYFLGLPDQALAASRAVVALARTLGHPLSYLTAVLTEALTHGMRGEAEEQRDDLAEVVALAETHDLPYWKALGNAYHLLARATLGETAALDAAPDVAELLTFGLGAPASFVQLAEAQLAAERLDAARNTVQAGRALAAATGQPFRDPDFLRLEADLLLTDGGDAAAAQALYRGALDLARSLGSTTLALRAATPLAATLACAGRAAEGRAILAPLYESFTEGFETADLRRAAAVLTRC